jgi:hypothetical protein
MMPSPLDLGHFASGQPNGGVSCVAISSSSKVTVISTHQSNLAHVVQRAGPVFHPESIGHHDFSISTTSRYTCHIRLFRQAAACSKKFPQPAHSFHEGMVNLWGKPTLNCSGSVHASQTSARRIESKFNKIFDLSFHLFRPGQQHY